MKNELSWKIYKNSQSTSSPRNITMTPKQLKECCEKCVAGDAGIYSGELSCKVCKCHNFISISKQSIHEEMYKRISDLN